MKNAFNRLDKLFENKVRLGIMSLLMVEEWQSYNAFKKALSPDWPKEKISDGNLASHIKKLRDADYIEEKKEFHNRKPRTSYKASAKGKVAFSAHLDALEEIIKGLG